MFRIRRKKSKIHSDSPSNKQLAIRLTEDGVVEIDYNPERPPDVFFDTNVLLGFGVSGINSLQHLQSKRGFRFRSDLAISNIEYIHSMYRQICSFQFTVRFEIGV